MKGLLDLAVDYAKEYSAATIIQLVNIPLFALTFWMKKKALLVLNIVCCVLFAAGYALLDAWAGVVATILTAIIVSVALVFNYKKIDTRKVLTAIWVCSVFLIILFNFAFDRSMISWLAVIAGSINCYNYLVRKENDVTMKWLFLTSSVLLVIYECIVRLPLFALIDIIAAISIIVSLVKALWNRRNASVIKAS